MGQINKIDSNSRFPKIFFGRYQVWGLSENEIDEMLANGWFRNDRHVMTSLGRYVEQQWQPILMLRVFLQGFVWKKRLRKNIRKNSELFEVKIRPFVPRMEIERVWQSFKRKVHGWEIVPDLSIHLFKGLEASLFQTSEISVYKGSQLVAFCLFDKGKSSIASLEAAYDPKYTKFSLGLFTMLLEIDYCLKEKMDYYYPGFYAKNSSMFNYKLRPGNIQYYNYRLSKWCEWKDLKDEDWLLDEIFQKLKEADQLLKSFGFKTSIKAFNKLNDPKPLHSVSNYNFLAVAEQQFSQSKLLLLQIAWDPFYNKYLLFKNKSESLGGNAVEIPFLPFKFEGLYRSIDDLGSDIKKLLAESIDSQYP